MRPNPYAVKLKHLLRKPVEICLQQVLSILTITAKIPQSNLQTEDSKSKIMVTLDQFRLLLIAVRWSSKGLLKQLLVGTLLPVVSIDIS